MELAQAVVQADRIFLPACHDGRRSALAPSAGVAGAHHGLHRLRCAQPALLQDAFEIEKNPKVELCYPLDDHVTIQVRITGRAEVVTDRAILQEIWDANPLLRQYLGTIDNPELIVYVIQPGRVRYMKEWALEYMNVPLFSENSTQPPTMG